MDTPALSRDDARINWYRCKVDKQIMNQLMQRSDLHGFRQTLGQLALFAATGALAYTAYRNINAANWYWSMPLLFAALFVHGTGGPFVGLVAVHELCHKTPFKSPFWNEFFLKLYSFLSWSDYVWFRRSHIKHHQFTVHKPYDGEVVLPQELSFKDWKFWLGLVAWNPQNTWNVWKAFYQRARGRIEGDWYQQVLPETNQRLRRDHRNWARFVLIGHAALAAALVSCRGIHHRYSILRLAGLPVRHTTAFWSAAQCAGLPVVLPHFHLFPTGGLLLLEHAIPY